MKKYFIFLILLVSNFCLNAQDKNTDDARVKIIEKAKKFNLKPSNNYIINIQQYTNNSDGKFAYYADFSNFNAAVYYKTNTTEAYAVWGEIYNEYIALLSGNTIKNKEGRLESINQKYLLGAPISDEFKTPNKAGVGQHFEGGSIYWSAKTGAHEVHGAIRDKWKSLGWENSFLGFPTTNETATPDGYGRFNFFEGGAIYFHPHLGTFAIPNMIIETWKKEGWEKGKLGYPTSDEVIKNNNSVQYFEFGAIISTKAEPYKIIFNSLRDKNGVYTKWRATGGVDSYLGDLVTGNRNYPKQFSYHFAEFKNGFIYETPIFSGTTAYVIKKGPIFDYYAKKGWEAGSLGYPISDEATASDGTLYQNFEKGTIYYSKSVGAFETKK